MPRKIDEYRAAAGGLPGVTDEQIAKVVYDAYAPLTGKSFDKFAPEIGYDPDSNFTRRFGQGIDETVGGLTQVGAGVARRLGATQAAGYLQEAADNRYNAAAAKSRANDDIDNAMSGDGNLRAWVAGGLGYLGAQMLPSLVPGGAAGVGARMAGMSARAAGAIGAGAAYAGNLAQETGAIYRDNITEGRDELGRSAAFAVPAAALDTVSDLTGLGIFGKAGGRLASRIARGTVKSAATETTTELGQTAIERAGAYKSLNDSDAWHDYRNAAALAVLGGGTAGAAKGFVPAREQQKPKPVPDPNSVDPAELERQYDMLAAAREADLARTEKEYDALGRAMSRRKRAMDLREPLPEGPLEQVSTRPPPPPQQVETDAELAAWERWKQQEDSRLKEDRAYDLLARLGEAARREDSLVSKYVPMAQDIERSMPAQGDLFTYDAPPEQRPGFSLEQQQDPVRYPASVSGEQLSLDLRQSADPRQGELGLEPNPAADILSRYGLKSTPKRMEAATAIAALGDAVDAATHDQLSDKLAKSKFGEVSKLLASIPTPTPPVQGASNVETTAPAPAETESAAASGQARLLNQEQAPSVPQGARTGAALEAAVDDGTATPEEVYEFLREPTDRPWAELDAASKERWDAAVNPEAGDRPAASTALATEISNASARATRAANASAKVNSVPRVMGVQYTKPTTVASVTPSRARTLVQRFADEAQNNANKTQKYYEVLADIIVARRAEKISKPAADALDNVLNIADPADVKVLTESLRLNDAKAPPASNIQTNLPIGEIMGSQAVGAVTDPDKITIADDDGDFEAQTLTPAQQATLDAVIRRIKAKFPAMVKIAGARSIAFGSMTHQKDGGVYYSGDSVVLIEQRLFEPGREQDLLETVAHELAHVVDFHIANDVGARYWASEREESVFGAVIDADDLTNPRIKFSGPVLVEALVRRSRLPEYSALAKMLEYPLLGVMTARDAPPTLQSFAAIRRGLDHAQLELGPRLVEIYLQMPDAMRVALPEGYKFVESLMAARTEQDIINAYFPNQSNPRPDQGTRNPVRRAVRSAADPARQSDAGRNRSATGQVAGVGQPRANVAPAHAPQRSGLELGDSGERFALPPVREAKTLRERLSAFVTDAKVSGFGLGAMTLRQIGDTFKSPDIKKFVTLTQEMVTYARKKQGEAFRVDLEWKKLDPTVAESMQKMMLEATLEGVHPDRNPDGFNLEAMPPALVAKWRQLHATYTGLVAKDANVASVYKKALAKMESDWKERTSLLRDNVVRAYAAELPEAKGLSALKKADRAAVVKSLKSPAKRKAAREMFDDIDQLDDLNNRVKGPYFPLIRFGRHIVVTKSAEYDLAKNRLDGARKDLADIYAQEIDQDDKAAVAAQEADIELAKAEVTQAQSALSALKENEKDYSVTFFEKRSDAERYEQDVKEKAQREGRTDVRTYLAIKEEYQGALDAAPPGFIRRLEDTLSGALPAKDAAGIRAAVRDLVIQSMPDRSAMKSELRRMNVRGAQAAQIRRAFSAAAARNSWHISRLKYGDLLNESLQALRASQDTADKTVADELARRYVQSLSYAPGSALADFITSASYVSFLGLSPSFLMMNLSQPWVISAPLMAARHGGMGDVAKELGAAFSETAKAMKQSWKDQRTWRFEIDLSKFSNQNERSMLEALFDRGIIDITFEHDVGATAAGRDSTKFDTAVQIASLPAHHTEVMNRVMTALAAYRLELARTGNAQLATMYAEKIVHESHLDYTAENAPRWFTQFGAPGRVVLQFKKYTQGMMYLLFKNMAGAIKKGDQGKEARKFLGYLVGMQVAVSGMAGIPFSWVAGAIAAMASQLSDDDDEPDYAFMFRRAILDTFGETVGSGLLKGAPAMMGANLSNRMGMGDLGNPLSFNRADKEGKDWWAYTLMSLLGPAASLVGNYADAASVAASDPAKAAALVLPKVFADPLKAVSQSQDGIKTRAGNQIVTPEEITAAEAVIRALGMQPTSQANMYERRVAFQNAKDKRDKVRNQLIQDYVKAQKSGNTAEVEQEIQGFNSRHPDARITYSSLRRAAVAKQKYQDELVGGVRVGRRDRYLAEEMGLE